MHNILIKPVKLAKARAVRGNTEHKKRWRHNLNANKALLNKW